MSDPQPTITANVSEKTRIKARRMALDAGKSLRAFSGEIIEERLAEKRSEPRAGKRMPKTGNA